VSAGLLPESERSDTWVGTQGKEALAELRASIYYYENVAQSNGDLARQKALEETTAKLRRVLAHVEEEVTCE
jgi:hypothetical protein